MKNKRQQKQQLKAFKAAKELAQTIQPGTTCRAILDGEFTQYQAFKDKHGQAWVIADSIKDLMMPDAVFDGYPARKVESKLITLTPN